MEMAGILQKGVIGSQVGATTEPPHRSGLEVAVIEMHRRHPGIAGVQHHRGADRKPTVPFGLRALVEDRRRQLGPLHLRKIDAPLFEDPALLHHPGAATAALRPLPTLLLKLALPIERLEPLTDRILQPHQQGPGPAAGVDGRHLHGKAAWGQNRWRPYSNPPGASGTPALAPSGPWPPGSAPSRPPKMSTEADPDNPDGQ